MNKILKTFGSTMLMAVAIAACSPDEFDGGNQGGIPSISGVDIQVDVDQKVNQASYSANGLTKGTYPIWVLDGKTYSTLSKATYSNTKAGTHELELRVGNKNGFSQGSVSKTFTFNNTITDFTPYISRISRQWRINYSVQGHMGCGEPGTDGSNWWSANPNDKADWGVYDDRITFTADGTYTYNPGEGGTVYVNTKATIFTESNTNDGNDFMATVGEQTTAYSFDADGEKILLRLPANTLFPYLSSDAQYANPVFTVSKLTNSEMILLYEGEDITWRFVLTSEEETEEVPVEVEWVAVDSPDNLGAGFNTAGTMGFWWADAGWSQTADPGFSYSNGVYTITAAENGGSEWQAQCSITGVPLKIEKGQGYDVSVKVKASADLARFTVKVNKDPDITNDPNTLCYRGNFELYAGENILTFENVVANNAGEEIEFDQGKIIFDFGGAPAGFVAEISDIIIQKHTASAAGGDAELAAYKEALSGTWRIDNDVEKHMGCGPGGGDGTGWWTAQPNEKSDVGLYDDRITFNSDGSYTYDPGEGGTVYINWGCTEIFHENWNGQENVDYTANVDKQDGTWKVKKEGDKVLLILSDDTYFPYIPYNDSFYSPKFQIAEIADGKATFIADNGDIAWRFMFVKTDK